MRKTFIIIMTAILAFCFSSAGSLTVKAEKAVVDLNSGAARDGNFISVNEEFQTANGTRTLIMSGLKNENRDLLLSALGAGFDENGRDGLKVIDAAFADAEKWSADPDNEYGYDAAQC